MYVNIGIEGAVMASGSPSNGDEWEASLGLAFATQMVCRARVSSIYCICVRYQYSFSLSGHNMAQLVWTTTSFSLWVLYIFCRHFRIISLHGGRHFFFSSRGAWRPPSCSAILGLCVWFKTYAVSETREWVTISVLIRSTEFFGRWLQGANLIFV